VFFEARDQPIDGQYAVAEVVMNRVASDRYPDKVCEVVFQSRQFSFTHDGLSDDPGAYPTYYDDLAHTRAAHVASEVLERGAVLGLTSDHYHTLSVSPQWAENMVVDGVVGDHIFYTEGPRT
jgi:spore germination cell wall hydrolase CwlJ-like protein